MSTASVETTASTLTATVAICAYTMRRWSLLCDAVASVLPQLAPDDQCLIVIDHHDELLTAARTRWAATPRVNVLASTGDRGLSGARNTAIAASAADIVAFLDDDATADPGWLDHMRQCLADHHDVYGVGTAVRPSFPMARPSWLAPEYDWVVGCTYRGLPDHDADVRNVIGAAMAFRRDTFAVAGTFSTMVGRVGTLPVGCEETELCIRLRQADPAARVRYLPGAAVTHHVSPDRLRVRYFLRRCYGEGVSKARVSRLVGSEAALSSERRYLRQVLPHAIVRELRRGVRGDAAGFLAATLIIAAVFAAGSGYLLASLARLVGR